jgi:hypothetical protein
MLPIRQILNALPTSALNRTAKAVLIEVCRLAELNAQGWCTALNPYLVTCLGGTERTMTRALTLLEQRGLLVSKGQGKARQLAPTALLRTCYADPDEATRYAALVTLNLDKSGAQPRQNEPTNLDIPGPNLDKTDTEPRQNDEVEAEQPRQSGSSNLDKSGAQPRQNGSRVIGDQVNQVITSSPPTPEEWVGAQKKIADLEFQVAQLTAENLRLLPPVAQPPRQIAAESQGPQHSEASKALATEMAKVWKLSPMPNGGRKWAQLHRFTHQMELAGRLSEVAKQFAGYRAYLEKRRIEPFNLDKYLGAEADGYPGEWCQTIWSDKAQEAKADGDTVRGVPATPTRTNINLKTAATEQRQAIF